MGESPVMYHAANSQQHTCMLHTKYSVHHNNHKIHPTFYTAIVRNSHILIRSDLQQNLVWDGILFSYTENYNIRSPTFNTCMSKRN